PQTGAITSGHTCGMTVHTPPTFVQLPLRHSQKAPAPQSLSALQSVQGVATVDTSGHACPTSRRTFAPQLNESCLAWTVALMSEATQRTYAPLGMQQLHCVLIALSAVATVPPSVAPSPHRVR